MRTRPQPRQRWRVRLTLLAASCVLCWLRLVRRSLAPVAGLVVPTRWPACAPDGGTQTHAAPLQRRSFDGTRLAIVSTWLPTRCGIATYSAGLRSGLLATGASVDVVAVHLRSNEQHAYGPEARFRDRRVKLEAALRDTAQVVFTIRQDEPSDYVLAAHYLVEQRYDAVLLQHEYGVFGGYRGEHVVELLRHAAHTVPFVTTLHTVESVPSPMVQHALQQLLFHSVAVTALSPSGCRNVDAWPETVGMQASPASCQHVPHGVPLLPLCRKLPLKRALGTAGRFVVMCGGLLSPPKGVELVLKALPRIAASVPNVLLVVAGQAHPLLGRGYLKQLVELAASLGVSDLVEFHSSFLSEPDLLHMYQSADVFVCAHTSAEQTSSGTMLFAMASGVAVVATPFAQAAELLRDSGSGSPGMLVPFNKSASIADAVVKLFREPSRAQSMRLLAYGLMHERSWTAVAARYRSLLPSSPVLQGVRRMAPAQEESSSTAVVVHRSAAYAEASNAVIAVSVARNENWVDGVGPGWYPTDTFVSRYRPVWGVDSLVTSGCFIRRATLYQTCTHELREPRFSPARKYITRTLEELSAEFDVSHVVPDSSAVLEQRWRGAVQSSGTTAFVQRRFVVSQNSAAIQVELEASLSGVLVSGSDTWLTAGFDQLSVNPGVTWSSVLVMMSDQSSTTHEACSWAAATLGVQAVASFELQGLNRAAGRSTHFRVELLPGGSAAVLVHFTCNTERRLHAVEFDSIMLDSAVEPATKTTRLMLRVTWA